MRRTCGFSTSSSPIGPASPGACVTMFSTPGREARPRRRSRPRAARPTIGDHSDGLRTTVLPSASGAAIERAERISAAFQGAIAPTTPTGRRMPIAKAPGVGRDDLADRRVRERRRLAEEARHEVHLEHAEAEGAAGLAREQRDDLVRAALEDVGRLEEDPLPLGRRRLRPGRERRRGGLDRAPRIGARVPAGTRATTSPVNGSMSSNVPPPAASTHSPPMNCCGSRTSLVTALIPCSLPGRPCGARA